MKKKLVAGAVTLLSVVTLAACANGTNKDIVTMKGDTITVSDFYDEMKSNQGAQQVLFQMTINKVFEKEYGSKVSDKDVNKEFDKQKKQLGNQFDAYLAQQGLTEETAKKQIRSNMLLEYAVNQAAKKDIKDSDYKAAFESYTPEVTAQIIKLDSEDKAKEVLEAAKAEGADFAQIAKENSTDTATKDKGGEVKFDSGTADIPSQVKEAAFKLKDGQVSDVITSTNASTYTTEYYVVKMVKNQNKGNDMDKYKKELKEIATDTKLSDSTFQNKVIGEVLKDANVKIKDKDFENVLSTFTSDSSTASSK